MNVLESIGKDQSQKGETIQEAESTATKMQEPELVFMLTRWNEVLQQFDHMSSFPRKTCADHGQSLANHLYFEE